MLQSEVTTVTGSRIPRGASTLPPLPDDAILIEEYHPEGVSKIIGSGSSSFIGLLNDGKTVLKYPDIPGEGRERLVVEERIYQALCPHPRITTCFGLDERGLKLEYAPMGTLQDYLYSPNAANTITVADRLQWAIQATEGVSYIHTKRVIHCDISPRNLLLDKNLHVKLCDFQGEYVDEDGVRWNGYAAENNKAYLPRPPTGSDEKSDIFALGTTIYEIMSGHEPFPELHEHDDGEEIERRYRNGHFPDVDDVLCGTVIRKCWTLAYETADACLKDLKDSASLIGTDSATAIPIGIPEGLICV